jgi:hypothetical protein
VNEQLQGDNTRRACRCAVWIALLEAERAGWLDVRDDLYQLHAVVDDRVRQADIDQWRASLLIEGPHQPERDA